MILLFEIKMLKSQHVLLTLIYVETKWLYIVYFETLCVSV